MCARQTPSSTPQAVPPVDVQNSAPQTNEAGAESKHTAHKLKPGLYLVATPIGNLGDITLRALEVLRAAHVILCEDTRVTRKLCEVYGLTGKLISCHEHNQLERVPELEQAIRAGQIVALVSDAGMPLISDPGAPLVTTLQTKGLYVTVIPGANAVLSALSLAGLPSERFCFAGFLPAKGAQRRQELAELAKIPATLIFYESPNRVVDLLEDVLALMEGRAVAVVRELTKLHEEVLRGSAEDLLLHFKHHEPRGEMVVLIAPPGAVEQWSADKIDAALHSALANASLRDATAIVTAQSGWPKREVYARAVALTQKDR